MNSLSRQIFLWFLVFFNITSSNPIPRYREGDIIWVEGLNYTLGPDILDIHKRCPIYSYVVSQNATIDNFVNAYVAECPITKHEYNHNYSPVHINKALYGLIDVNTKTVLAVNLDIAQLQSLSNKNGSHLLWRGEGEDLIIESTFITELTNEKLSQSDELQKMTDWSDISEYVLSSFIKYIFYYVVGDAVLRFIEMHTERRVISNIVIAYEAIAWLSGAFIGNCARLFIKVFKKTRDMVENYFAQLI